MRKKILIVAKTYPTRSKKYTELVCTAGVDAEGNWYRIYPIPTKTLKDYEGLKKYTWIDAEITKDTSDSRPESYKINVSNMKLLHTLDSKNNWQYRKDIVLKSKIYRSLEEIISLANDTNELSLCLFKPTKFLHIRFENKEIQNFSEQEKKEFKNANVSLFEHSSSCEVEFDMMPQLPYSIKMVFEDREGKESKMNILDWEISQLYWNLSRSNSEKETKAKIKNKLESLIEKDLYLCLGTMKQMHGWTSNPFTIIGLFYPPKDMGYTASLF
jgi:predicted nuclease of predicted toxin-antitoxin system